MMFLKWQWTVWIGFRYLKSKKKSHFLSFITFLSIIGIGLGVAALIIVLSVMDGFEMELKKRMMDSQIHILIQQTPQKMRKNKDRYIQMDTSAFKNAQSNWDVWMQQVDPRILSFWPVITTDVILKMGQKVTAVTLKGVTDEQLDALQKEFIPISHKKNLPGVFIGQELAYQLNVVADDEVILISPTDGEGPGGEIPRLKLFYVEGIYKNGLPEQELHFIFTKQSAVRSFLKRSGILSQWEVRVKDFDDAHRIAEKMRKQVPYLSIQDWMQLNAHLFASLRLERFSMFLILAFIVVVASFNIVTTLTLMVLEKKKEISILKAMGAQNKEVGWIFFSEGLLIGIFGILGGILFGFLICLLLRRYKFISLPEIYYDQTLPVTFNSLYYLLISISALCIVLIACVYPSRRATRLKPLDGMRFG